MLAVVLAGGLGTRLRSAVPDLPKCLSPVLGRPFLAHVLDHLKRQGVERVVIAIGYKGDAIRREFGDGRDHGLTISYADDGLEPLGTGGAIANALRSARGPDDEPVLVVNGDTLSAFDVAELARTHHATKAQLVLFAVPVSNGTRYGALELGADGSILSFQAQGSSSSALVNGGVYWGTRQDFLSVLPARGPSSFEQDILPPLAGRGLFAVRGGGRFLDIGVPEGYRRAEAVLRSESAPPLVRARAPLRISFAGGGTDVSPYCDERGGAVLSATFNKYVHVSLVPTADDRMGLHSLDYQTSVHYDLADALAFDGRLDLIKACIKRVYPDRDKGFDIHVHADAPPGTGAGASSAVVVAVLAALREWLRLPMTEYELAETAFAVERCDLKIAGGRQDHYSAAFGGFNFIEFGPRGAIVNPLRIRPSIASELEERLVLVYTGGSRVSGGIIADQVRRYRAGEPEAVQAMDDLKALANESRRALLSGDLDAFGAITHRAWQSKKRMSDRISNPALDALYDAARSAGAIGGKVTGAGGGGYMFFVTRYDGQQAVVQALQRAGCQFVDFSFESAGARAWRVAESGLVG